MLLRGHITLYIQQSIPLGITDNRPLRVRTNSVETICEDCGLDIDGERIDQGPEWRTYGQGQRKRTGAPLTAARHDRGLSREIGHRTDTNGNGLSTLTGVGTHC